MKGIAWNSREHQSVVERRLTLKRYTPVDWSTKPTGEKPTSEIRSGTGNHSTMQGAIAIDEAMPKPPAFAARRASEALDRLAGTVTICHEKRGGLAAGLREQSGRTILIQAYTDSMGSAVVNDALSLRRAEAVSDYLATQGVAAETMRAEGQGSKRPLASNRTPDGRAQNRRIEIVITPVEQEVDGH
jgi:hypothetical protein